jgi:hypothetical protein
MSAPWHLRKYVDGLAGDSTTLFAALSEEESAIMDPIDFNAYRLLLAIGECHRLLVRHAINLRQTIGVKTVEDVTDMPDLPNGFRIEEFVDAELISGEAVSWRLEVTVAQEGVFVEADVRRIHSEGQDLILDVGRTSYAKDAQCAAALPEIARRLCSANPL